MNLFNPQLKSIYFLLEIRWILHCWTGGYEKKNKSGNINNWLVVSTHLKNISQNGNLPQFSGWKYKMFELPPPRFYSILFLHPFNKKIAPKVTATNEFIYESTLTSGRSWGSEPFYQSFPLLLSIERFFLTPLSTMTPKKKAAFFIFKYLEPKRPGCFDWSLGLVFGGLTFKNRGQLGSRYDLKGNKPIRFGKIWEPLNTTHLMSFAKGNSVFRTGSSLMEMKQVTLHGTRMEQCWFSL